MQVHLLLVTIFEETGTVKSSSHIFFSCFSKSESISFFRYTIRKNWPNKSAGKLYQYTKYTVGVWCKTGLCTGKVIHCRQQNTIVCSRLPGHNGGGFLLLIGEHWIFRLPFDNFLAAKSYLFSLTQPKQSSSFSASDPFHWQVWFPPIILCTRKVCITFQPCFPVQRCHPLLCLYFCVPIRTCLFSTQQMCQKYQLPNETMNMGQKVQM